MDKEKETWHERLRRARMRKGFSRLKLAEACNVAPGTVQDWEDGRIKRLTAGNAMTVASVLNVELDWLINGGDDLPEPTGTKNDRDEASDLISMANTTRKKH